MKRIILICLYVFLFSGLHAQDEDAPPPKPAKAVKVYAPKPKFQFGVGLQDMYPYYGASVKFAFTQHSVLEAIVAPGGSDYGLSFYGFRYIYRFPFQRWTNTFGYPYVFAGAGWMSWSYSAYNDYLNNVNYDGSTIGYLGGVGYEVVLFDHLAFHAELGYGQFSIVDNAAGLIPTGGGGVHWYFDHSDGPGDYQGTTVMGDEHTDIPPEGQDDDMKQGDDNGNGDNGAVDGDASNTGDSTAQELLVSSVPHFFLSGDIGQNSYTNDGFSGAYTGITGALSANMCQDLFSSPGQRMLLTYGIEGRTYNASASFTDADGTTGYNNYHFWYAGVPVSYIYCNNNIFGPNSNTGLYAQAGATAAYRAAVTDVNSDQGVKTTTTSLTDYNPIVLSASFSAGFTFRMPGMTLMAGPYVSNTFTNMSNNNDITESMFSYGLRISYIPNIRYIH